MYTRSEYEELLVENCRLKMKIKDMEKKVKLYEEMNKDIVEKRMQMYNDQQIIKDIIKKREDEYKKKCYQKPYYEEIRECVEAGFSNVWLISLQVNKSYSTVRRSLIDMNLWPIPKKEIEKMRLNL